MSETKEPTQGEPIKPEYAQDKFRVVLHAPSRKSLQQLLTKIPLDMGPMKSYPDTEEVTVDLFVTRKQIDQVKRTGWKLEVHENLSEMGRKRQEEVGKGDRFEGGKKPPSGLGEKTGKEG